MKKKNLKEKENNDKLESNQKIDKIPLPEEFNTLIDNSQNDNNNSSNSKNKLAAFNAHPHFDKTLSDLKKNSKFLKPKKTFMKDIIESKKSNKNIMMNKNSIIEEEINQNKSKIINNENKNYFKKIVNEFLGRDSLIKRTYSMPDLSYNYLLESKEDSRPDSLFLEKKSNINELNNLNLMVNSETIIEEKNEDQDRMSIIKIDDNKELENTNLNTNNSEDNGDNGEEKVLNNKYQLQRSKSFYKEKEMTERYYEENEHKNSNITFNNKTNKLESISMNLMLKKIIFEDFLKKQTDSIYLFCQQCFCFIKIDVFFGKILNCYKYYRKKNISMDKISNLIEFYNVLIIEMYEYYKIIPTEELEIIKNIYNEIVCDLVINNSNNNNSNNNDWENIIDKNELINDNLAIGEKEIENIFSYKNKVEENNNKEKENTEESIFFDKDYIVIEKDKDTFDENIFNEDKEFNKFLYTTFLEDISGTPMSSISLNYNNLIVSPEEHTLFDLYKFLNFFKSKRLSKEQLIDAKNLIPFFYNLKDDYAKNEFSKSPTKDYLHRSNCFKPISNNNISHRKYLKKGFFSILDWKVEEIGQKLIKVTKKLLKKIERRELYKAIYLKKDKNIKSPNVIENINSFNKLTFFIIEDIISYDQPSDRAKIIDKWIQVADYCKVNKDYNDTIAINSALNSYIITGLNLTNKELKSKSKDLIKNIGKFCACDGNYKNIREEIEKLNNKKEYFYPYLGMMLKDITFFEEKSKYLVDGELINFEKIENIHNIMENNFRFKFEDKKEEDKNKDIEELNFFDKLEMNTEEYLENIANQIEPKFLFNEGKKEFKRKTKMDEKYFAKYKNSLLLRKSTTASMNLLSLKD